MAQAIPTTSAIPSPACTLTHYFTAPDSWKTNGSQEVIYSNLLVPSRNTNQEGVQWRTYLDFRRSAGESCIKVGVMCTPSLLMQAAMDETVTSWSCVLKCGRFRVHGMLLHSENHVSSLTFSNQDYAKVLTEIRDPIPISHFIAGGTLTVTLQFETEKVQGLPTTWQALNRATSHAKISRDVLALLDSESDKDVVLGAEDGEEVPCHKLILTARVHAIRPAFQEGWKEEATNRIQMQGIRGPALKLFVRYVYGGCTEIDGRSREGLGVFRELLSKAHEYMLPDLMKQAAREILFLVNMENAKELLSFLEQYKEDVPVAVEATKKFLKNNDK